MVNERALEGILIQTVENLLEKHVAAGDIREMGLLEEVLGCLQRASAAKREYVMNLRHGSGDMQELAGAKSRLGDAHLSEAHSHAVRYRCEAGLSEYARSLAEAK